MRDTTLTTCSQAKLAAWPAVAEDREGCAYLVLMHPALTTDEGHSILWCVLILAAMAGAILL